MERGRRRLRLGAALLSAAVGGGVFLGTLRNDFAYDDALVVEQNEVVRSGRLLDAFSTPYHHGPAHRTPTYLYRPVTIASLALGSRAHGLRPAGYHAVNVLLHSAVSALVLALGLACGLSLHAALAGSLLFAVHPVHAEAVAAVAGRADLLAALFSLLALAAYLSLRDPAGRPKGAGIAFSSACLLAALLSKESPILLPVALLAWDLLGRRRQFPGAVLRATRMRDLLLPASAFAASTAVYLASRAAVLGALAVPASSMTPIENPMLGLALPERLMTGAVVAVRSFGLLVFPWRLSPDYGFAETVAVRSPAEPRLLIAAAILLLAAAAAVASSRRSAAAAFLVVLFLSSWIVVSNLVLLIGTVMADRLLYLPSVAFCLLAGMAWEAARRRFGRPLWTAAGIGLLLAGSLRTVWAASAWRDDYHLFAAAEKAAPRSVRVLGNLGVELARRGRLEEAGARLLRAVEIAPDFVPNRVNLAGVYLKMGDLEAAEREVRHALRVEPANAVALLQLGVILERRADAAGAEDAYERAAAADPKLAEPRLRLASLALAQGDTGRAVEALEAALALEPRSIPALRGLALAAMRRGDPAGAVSYLERAASLAPDDLSIRRELEQARDAARAAAPASPPGDAGP